MNINVRFREEGKFMKGFVEGEIDTFTAPILREELDSIRMEEGQTIEINLSKVTYMDSTGLGIFVGFYKKASREKVAIKLVGLTNRLARLFEITGLKDLMIIEVDEKVGTGNESI
ncbi:MAG: STAS domain-containing protein [Lysinibacillus sp.]